MFLQIEIYRNLISYYEILNNKTRIAIAYSSGTRTNSHFPETLISRTSNMKDVDLKIKNSQEQSKSQIRLNN